MCTSKAFVRRLAKTKPPTYAGGSPKQNRRLTPAARQNKNRRLTLAARQMKFAAIGS
ncbi:MAG: hypothetical protein ACRCUY_12095 [Thermoguttaceae bacterium]